MANRRVAFAFVVVLASFTAACATTSINKVLADPGRYRNDTITVRGTVAESASVLGRGAYRITEKDQGLWVITNGGAPRKGARVDVKGRVQEGFDLGVLGNVLKVPGSIQGGIVLIESSHKAH